MTQTGYLTLGDVMAAGNKDSLDWGGGPVNRIPHFHLQESYSSKAQFIEGENPHKTGRKSETYTGLLS